MRCARLAFNAPPFLAVLLLSGGCYGPYQSPYGGYASPYGNPYGGYPTQGAPVQTLQPGGTYTPYGQPVIPQESFGTPSPIDQTGGNAPFYNGSGTTSPPAYDGGGVPTYSDPSEVQFQQPIPRDNTAVEEFGGVDTINAEVAEVARVDLDNAHFVAPVMAQPATAEPTFSSIPAAPYAYDANYEWLRGVLRFDASTTTWTMTYSDNPAADDVHGGRLLVADSPELAPLKPQAVVLVRGHVDAARSEAAGRAVYHIDAIEPVELALP